MGNKYIVLSIKATGGALSCYETGLISYKDYMETTRSFFCVPQGEESPYEPKEKKACILDEIANRIQGATIVGFGSFSLFASLFKEYNRLIKFNYIDCEQLINQVLPCVKGYPLARLEELFRFHEAFVKDSFFDCCCIQKIYAALFMFIGGKQLHEVFPFIDCFLSGYWDRVAVPDKFARLAILSGRKVVVAGEFKKISRECIETVVRDSGGEPQGYPDAGTSVTVAGNTEFPAVYQTRAVHESLLRVRRGQDIRVISELELLSLLHGQVTWDKQVNKYYSTAKTGIVPVPAVIGNLVESKKGFIQAKPPIKADKTNTVSLTRKTQNIKPRAAILRNADVLNPKK